MEAKPLLTIEKLTIHYGAAQALFGVDLQVRQGETVAIVGANGAGKSSLLKAITGLLPLSGGRVLVDGLDVTGKSSAHMATLGVALVPEGREMFGHLSVRDNLVLGALAGRASGAETDKRLAEVFARFPKLKEGDLSRLRAHLVRQESLHRIAQKIHLGAVLRLGEGELKSGGFSRPSILADALEAVVGAIFLDGGFESARAALRTLFAEPLGELDPRHFGKDPKTQLQELLQARHVAVPRYAVVATQGAAHDQRFEVECVIESLQVRTRGVGTSRRAAEQEAARAAFEAIHGG